jgi:quinohemoprotein ethanol dehydrogenase
VLGTFVAFRATDGQQLWSWNAPDAMAGGPVTYLVNGEQYVAVISGALSYSGTATPRVRHNGRMLAFKLNGRDTFPPDPPLAQPPNPPQEVASPRQVALGEAVYNKRCGLCHGFNAVSSNIVPDLRRSAFLTSPDGWQSVVIGGALTPRGMIGWKQYVTPAQAEAVRAYIGEQSRALKLDLDHNARPAAAAATPGGPR